LQPDDKYEFSDPARIQGLVKNYSQFVSFPIYTWQEKSRTVEVRYLKLFPLTRKVVEEIENIGYVHSMFI
jgi:HSP90 family molecular chaperone